MEEDGIPVPMMIDVDDVIDIDNPFKDRNDEDDEESEGEDEDIKRTCCICFDQFPEDKIAWQCYECNYYFCRNDFVRFCFSTHRNNMPGIPQCIGCDYKVEYRKIREVLGNKMWNKWAEQRSLATIKGSRSFIPCPGIDCHQW